MPGTNGGSSVNLTHAVHIAAAMAIYKVHGAVQSIRYLTAHTGISVSDAVDVLDAYDKAEEVAQHAKDHGQQG